MVVVSVNHLFIMVVDKINCSGGPGQAIPRCTLFVDYFELEVILASGLRETSFSLFNSPEEFESKALLIRAYDK